MISALAVVLEYLSQDADLAELVAGRIAAKHRFGEAAADAWTTPALQVTYAPGVAVVRRGMQTPQLECRAYGGSQVEAEAVYRQVYRICRDFTHRKVVETGEGKALLYSLSLAVLPQPMIDPDTGMDSFFFYLVAGVSEEAVS